MYCHTARYQVDITFIQYKAATLTHLRHMVTHGVSIGLGDVLLPDGPKPLPEPMLTYNQRGYMAFI